MVELHSNNEEDVPSISIEEVEACVMQLNSGKATGPDLTPIEQYKHCATARTELYHLITTMWDNEQIPEDFVLADMLMLYKRKGKDNRSNYRALGLLNHSYKTFSMVLLSRMVPFIDPKLSDTQAGFRKDRGCRDNILILTMAIHHLLSNAEDEVKSAGIITYIDFVAAFDSILHSYMLESLKQYGVPLKYVRLVNVIYQSAAVRVRIQEAGGNRCYSRSIPVRRGAIQGDIPSPVIFLVALDRLLKEHGGLHMGLPITVNLTLTDLEFADDAAIPEKNTETASQRLTHLDRHANIEAGMCISVPKTKVQHIRKRARVTETTEEDVANLPPEKKFKFVCDKCNMSYPKQHSLSVHKGRWCKGSRSAKKPSRKGTVADRIITRLKVEKNQETLSKVMMGNEILENVYAFPYLGAEIAGDGNQEVTLKHRTDIAWARFVEHRKVLSATKLPISLRIRLYACLIVSTMVYGSSALLFTEELARKLNGVSSKMLSIITKRSVHDEARDPTFDTVISVRLRRWNYLGHILRLEEHRAVRRYLLDLSPVEAPFIHGSLLDDTQFQTVQEAIEAASDREHWKGLWDK